MMAGSTIKPETDPAEDASRTYAFLPLRNLLERMTSRWLMEQNAALQTLKERWAEVSTKTWAQDIQPVAIDGDGRLLVKVKSAPAIAMEVQRKGRRWRQLLDGVVRVSGYGITDVVLAPPYSLRGRLSRERNRGNE